MIEIFRPRRPLIALRRVDGGNGFVVMGGIDDGLVLDDLSGSESVDHFFERVNAAELPVDQFLAALGETIAPNGNGAGRPVKKPAKRTARRMPNASGTEGGSAKPKGGRRPREVSWDVALAEKLWKDPAVTAEQIAARVGAPSKKAVTAYANTHRDRFPKRPRGGARPHSGPRRQLSRFCASCSNNVTGDPCPVCGAPA